MQIQINDQWFEVGSADTLADVMQRFCAQSDLKFEQIAVAQGASVIPRSHWAQASINATQPYAVFAAVAGG